MKTLIVAGNQEHASTIRRQFDPRDTSVNVVFPGDMLHGRYDTIFITDLYTRERHFTSPAMRDRMDEWMRHVQCRLADPRARMIQL